MARKKYVIVGTGVRSGMYTTAISDAHKDVAELVAYCDTNQTRIMETSDKLII